MSATSASRYAVCRCTKCWAGTVLARLQSRRSAETCTRMGARARVQALDDLTCNAHDCAPLGKACSLLVVLLAACAQVVQTLGGCLTITAGQDLHTGADRHRGSQHVGASGQACCGPSSHCVCLLRKRGDDTSGYLLVWRSRVPAVPVALA